MTTAKAHTEEDDIMEKLTPINQIMFMGLYGVLAYSVIWFCYNPKLNDKIYYVIKPPVENRALKKDEIYYEISLSELFLDENDEGDICILLDMFKELFDKEQKELPTYMNNNWLRECVKKLKHRNKQMSAILVRNLAENAGCGNSFYIRDLLTSEIVKSNKKLFEEHLDIYFYNII